MAKTRSCSPECPHNRAQKKFSLNTLVELMKSEGSENFIDLDPGHIVSNSWNLNWVFSFRASRFSLLYHSLLQTGFEIKAIRGEWIGRLESLTLGFSSRSRGSESTSNAGTGFNPWVGNEDPIASGQLSPCSASTEPTFSRAHISCKERSFMPQ